MPSLFLALLGVFVAALGGKDQRLMAVLRGHFGPALPLLVAGLAAAAASAALAAWAGAWLGRSMSVDAARMFTAFALALAGGELLLAVRSRPPAEPTRSAGATALALLASQVTDAARFVVLALAATLPSPLLVGAGGAIGGAAALALAWAMPEALAHVRLTLMRRLLGAGVLAAAATMALRARGVLG